MSRGAGSRKMSGVAGVGEQPRTDDPSDCTGGESFSLVPSWVWWDYVISAADSPVWSPPALGRNRTVEPQSVSRD